MLSGTLNLTTISLTTLKIFDVVHTTRGIKGMREDDENGLMSMLMELTGAGGLPRGRAGDNDGESEGNYVLNDESTD